MTRGHLLLVLLICMIWGLNGPILKLTAAHVPPTTATVTRFLIVTALCAPALKWVPGRMPALIGTALLIGCIQFLLSFQAIAHATHVGAINLVTQMHVPFGLIMAVAFLGEHIRWRRTLGIVLSFLGVVVIGFDPMIMHESVALVLGLGAALTYAAGSVLLRQLRGVPPLTIQAWVGLLGLGPLVLASLYLEPGALAALPQTPPHVFGYLLYTGVIVTVVAHTVMYLLLQRYPVSVIMPYTLIAPVLTILFAMLILGERMTPRIATGSVLTMIGIAIITLRSARHSETGDPAATPSAPA